MKLLHGSLSYFMKRSQWVKPARLTTAFIFFSLLMLIASRLNDALSFSTLQSSKQQTVLTSLWSPPSPDPAGIAYIPTTNTLLISDPEVDEVSRYAGVNVWQATLDGTPVQQLGIIEFSDEPTGVAFNPRNQHLFFSDDSGIPRIYELAPGPDGLYGTPDDAVTSFVTSLFSSRDPEGLTYNTHKNRLVIADGANKIIYEIEPGRNGIYDGVPPDGDDIIVNQFDTENLGLEDPEGIDFNQDTGTYFIVSRGDDEIVVEASSDGSLIRVIDVSDLKARAPSGITYAPSSGNPLEKSLYLLDRGTDNDFDPDENDGKMYEIPLGPPTPALFIDDVILEEGNGGGIVTMEFTVTLSSVSLQTVTVDYTTTDSSATTADNDYEAVSGRLIFEPYETSKIIKVLVNGDTDRETDEAFFIHLSNAINAPILIDKGKGIILHDDGSPQDFQLKQNFPNPFSSTTTIPYKILKPGYVQLKVYNLLGEEIRTLVARSQETGAYTIDADMSGLPSGMYFYTLQINNERVETRKMIFFNRE